MLTPRCAKQLLALFGRENAQNTSYLGEKNVIRADRFDFGGKIKAFKKNFSGSCWEKDAKLCIIDNHIKSWVKLSVTYLWQLLILFGYLPQRQKGNLLSLTWHTMGISSRHSTHNSSIWATALLPLPQPNLLSVDCCWVRGRVGVQLFRYWHLSAFATHITTQSPDSRRHQHEASCHIFNKLSVKQVMKKKGQT